MFGYNYLGPYLSDGKFQQSVAFGKSKPKNSIDAAARKHDTFYALNKRDAYALKAADDIFVDETYRESPLGFIAAASVTLGNCVLRPISCVQTRTNAGREIVAGKRGDLELYYKNNNKENKEGGGGVKMGGNTSRAESVEDIPVVPGWNNSGRQNVGNIDTVSKIKTNVRTEPSDPNVYLGERSRAPRIDDVATGARNAKTLSTHPTENSAAGGTYDPYAYRTPPNRLLKGTEKKNKTNKKKKKKKNQ